VFTAILKRSPRFQAELPDFSLYNIPKREKYTKKDHKIYQLATKFTKWP
jgi:hypothetical protein